jgi:GNAT superfamily N-acetyltransferase
MCDEWMPIVRFALSGELFQQLPRHAAYRYEFVDGEARLTPRPRFYHALLDLDRGAAAPSPEGVGVRPVHDQDFGALENVFAGAFERQQPFSGLERAVRLEAARRALHKTCSGHDGPWIRQASFTAVADRHTLIGAILVTLLPDADPTDWDGFRWQEPPPADCIERRLGRPHLTWIFVEPWHAGRGTGTALLAAVVRSLRGMGYRQLASTFMAGNDSSILWHWRNGFELQAYPGSRRSKLLQPDGFSGTARVVSD